MERQWMDARVSFLFVAGVLCLAQAVPGLAWAGSAAEFQRGDADGSGKLAVTDAIHIVRYLYLGEEEAVGCLDAADADDDGRLQLPDAVYVLQFLFREGSSPPEPFPTCDQDPTDDSLDCAHGSACSAAFQYFGYDFEAGAVFFVIDRSGSQANGGLDRSKAETVHTIGDLPAETELGMYFVASYLMWFPTGKHPAVADPETKAAALDWIARVRPGSSSCPAAGLLAAIDMARQAHAAKKIIFFVSDGGGTCSGQDEGTYLDRMLAQVTDANEGEVPIHTFGLGVSTELQSKHLQALADQNGGTYHEISRE
jgi:hypothetical protein